MKSKLIVLAGNRKQFELYIKENRIKQEEAVYVYDFRILLHVGKVAGVVEVGTFRQRKDAADLWRLAHELTNTPLTL